MQYTDDDIERATHELFGIRVKGKSTGLDYLLSPEVYTINGREGLFRIISPIREYLGRACYASCSSVDGLLAVCPINSKIVQFVYVDKKDLILHSIGR